MFLNFSGFLLAVSVPTDISLHARKKRERTVKKKEDRAVHPDHERGVEEWRTAGTNAGKTFLDVTDFSKNLELT